MNARVLAPGCFALLALSSCVSSSPPPQGGYGPGPQGGPGYAQQGGPTYAPGPQQGPAQPPMQGGAGSAPRPQGAPEATVHAALQAALSNNFAAYLDVVHSNEKSNATQRTNIEQFSWARFVKQASWYVQGQGPAMRFEVVRRSEEGADLMLFLRDFVHAERMPTPVRLRPDNGAWRIVTNSL